MLQKLFASFSQKKIRRSSNALKAISRQDIIVVVDKRNCQPLDHIYYSWRTLLLRKESVEKWLRVEMALNLGSLNSLSKMLQKLFASFFKKKVKTTMSTNDRNTENQKNAPKQKIENFDKNKEKMNKEK